MDYYPIMWIPYLDIGSGAGQNLLDLKKLYPSCTAFAIEPSLEAQKYLKSNDIKVLADDVSANWHNEYSHKFDIIIMRHVLEHFLDPQEILHKVRSMLSENGILYLAVPNCLTPQKPLQTHWFRVVHTYYFNKFSLQNIAALNNLKIVGIFEGDTFNKGEIYSFLKKSDKELRPNIQKKHYLTQREVFKKRIKKEESFVYRLKNLLKKALKKIIR